MQLRAAVEGAISALAERLKWREDRATAAYVLAELSKHGKTHLDSMVI